MSPLASPAAPAFSLSAQGDHLTLLEVEGPVVDAGVLDWTQLLSTAATRAPRWIVVDLRGCRELEPNCLDALLGVASRLKSQGGGIGVVSFPGSPVDHTLRLHAEALPAYTSVQQTLLSWRSR